MTKKNIATTKKLIIMIRVKTTTQRIKKLIMNVTIGGFSVQISLSSTSITTEIKKTEASFSSR